MKYNLILLLIASFWPQLSYAITPQKEKDIHVLLSKMGEKSMPNEVADMMVYETIRRERERNPKMSKKIEHIISETIHKEAKELGNILISNLVPIYDKYYTHNEIRQLIKFFSSPIGLKYSSVLKPMMTDMIPINQKWSVIMSEKTLPKIIKEYRKIGYIK